MHSRGHAINNLIADNKKRPKFMKDFFFIEICAHCVRQKKTFKFFMHFPLAILTFLRVTISFSDRKIYANKFE